MLACDLLQSVEGFEHEEPAIEIKACDIGLGAADRLPGLNPLRERPAIKQAGGKRPLLTDGPLAGGSCADHPLHQAEEQRNEKLKLLAVAEPAPSPPQPLRELMRALSIKLRQPGEGRNNLAVERNALAGGKFERAPYAALTERERGSQRLGLDLVIVAHKRRPHGLIQIVVNQRADSKYPATRADGDGNPPLHCRHQEEQRPRRRLFKPLQQCIGRVLVYIVGAIDNDHAPSGLPRAMAEQRSQAANFVDADPLRITLRLVVPGPSDQE